MRVGISIGSDIYFASNFSVCRSSLKQPVLIFQQIMIVLSLSKKIQVFIGVYWGNRPGSYLYKLVMNAIFIAGMLSILVLGSLAYIVFNFTNLATTTNAIVIMMAGCSGLACYLGITANIKSIRYLYELLQNIADESNTTNCDAINAHIDKAYFNSNRFEISWIFWISRS